RVELARAERRDHGGCTGESNEIDLEAELGEVTLLDRDIEAGVGRLVDGADVHRARRRERRKLLGLGPNRATSGTAAPRGDDSRREHNASAHHSVFRGVGSRPKMRAALRPRMLRLACSVRNGRSAMVDGRSKSKCGQSEANRSWVSALIISRVHCSAFWLVI